ncbi:centromere-associated protein E isoform X2 [Asparagus officinalis]|uniref:centromere-associated protein E isoform X2 n=1 Tax=Asparagus officinalis TaxID=4686 RepID=UPI00098E1C00|nr:centromere-associated protein E isoform X2 [Asparagus officinalis]
MQEANHSGSQEFNGEILENREDEADGSIHVMAPDSERTNEDGAAASTSSEVTEEGAESLVFDNSENGRDRNQTSPEEHVIRVGMIEESITPDQEATQSSFLAGRLEEVGSIVSDKPEERTPIQENSDAQSLEQNMLFTNSEGGIIVVDAEGEQSNNEETAIHHILGLGATQEEARSSILAEELQVEDASVSDKAEESSAVLPLSQDFLSAAAEDNAAPADEEGDRRNDEKAMLLSEWNLESNGPPLPDILLMEGNMSSSYRPEDSISVEETLDTILSASQGTLLMEEGDGASICNEEGDRRNDEEFGQHTGRTEEVDGSSIHSEALFHKARVSLSDEPEGTSYTEENLENSASSTKDIPHSKSEDVAIITDTGEEKRNMEERVAQSSPGKNATVESLEKLSPRVVVSFWEMTEEINKEDSHALSSNEEVEDIRQLLYITTLEKDVFRLQLEEQIVLSAEKEQHSFDEMLKLRDLVKETQNSRGMINEELDKCRSELQAMTIAKDELGNQFLFIEGEMEELQIRANELQNNLKQSQKGLSQALAELAGCRASLDTLQKEKLDLTQNIISERDARKKLMDENNFFSSENKKLASEVLEKKDQLIIALNELVQLQSSLRDAGPCIEQLIEENLYLASSLDVHKAKIRELNGTRLELPFKAKESGNTGMVLLQKDPEKDHDNSILFGILKQQLQEANIILHNLENSVDNMHSYAVSLSRSGGKAAAPGISKIIQAFESKAHNVESVSDEMPSPIEVEHPEDSYAITKEQTSSLGDILKKMDLELEKAELPLAKEQNSREHFSKSSMESEPENQQNSFFQERIDGLVENVSAYKSKIAELENHIDEIQQGANEETARLLSQVEMLQKEVNDRSFIYKQEEDSIRGVIINATGKLNASTGLYVGDGLDVGSHVVASVDAALLAITRLREKLETASVNYSTLETSFEDLSRSFSDMQGRYILAVEILKKTHGGISNVVCDSYQSVEDTLIDVTADESLENLGGNFDLLIGHLQKLNDEYRHLLSKNTELEVGLLNRNHDIEELNMRCDALSKELENECRGKDGLESILMNRGKTFEELSNKVCLLSERLGEHESGKELDAVSMSMTSENMETDFCMSMLSRLEALIASHLQKHEEIIEQLNSSKICLQEGNIATEVSAENWSLPLNILLKQELVPKVSELKDKVQLLSASNLQQEAEIKFLKEGLSKMEEAMEVSHSELNSKVSELELSEQRLSSVREKLSIAVAKGKGLVLQRDNLKQSLMEKSSELERCVQELQAKETLLHEVEAKLKSCSEVDRVEALESELSYIRNSATALRDSFLLKDSVLQRIEEVLEDLDLPEHFHSKDIVEKIELLSRLVAGNSSFPMTDWDQKSSEGRSHSDAGYVVTEAWKDEIQPNSTQELDDLKRKYEELQSKFYGLAEHNDMLEQSLLERNRVVQKWEEMLDRIDMPSRLRTSDPEDRLESLGRALSEIQQERDALQLKIENLEVSTDMLIVDLEESHKKISELSAEVVTVKSEKDFFSESLDKLRFQYLALSEKAVHDEVERENLQRELAILQQKLVKEVEVKGHQDLKNEIRNLHDLVLNTLPDGDRIGMDYDGSEITSLEALLRKLVHNYIMLSENSKHPITNKEAHFEESNSSLDKQSSRDVLHDKDQELSGLRVELDEASRSLILVKEERDETMEKYHSLKSEIEETTRQMNLLREERDHDMKKYQSLMLELEAVGKHRDFLQEQLEKYQSVMLEFEAMGKHRDTLQEQLSQEEQKTAAAREKLNVAVRKGKALVQQRDALKQTIEEMNTMAEHLKIEHNKQIEALESEKSFLVNQLAESKQNLEQHSQKLNELLSAVLSIDIGRNINVTDPILKMEEIGKVSRDLHLAVVSFENEAKKSKQAAELLLVELNEVQDRVDILQEDLEKAEAALAESYKQKLDAEAAKMDAVSRLEQFMLVHSDERKKALDTLMELKSGIDKLTKGRIVFSNLFSDVLRKDMDTFSHLKSYLESILQQVNDENVTDLPVLECSNLHINPTIEENAHADGDVWLLKFDSHFGDSLIAERLALACSSLHECTREYDDLKDKIHQHLYSIHEQATFLSEILETVKRKLVSQKEYSESLKREVTSLELAIKEKENEISSARRNVSLLYQACRCSIEEIQDRKAQTLGRTFTPEGHSSEASGAVTLLPYIDEQDDAGGHIVYTDHSIGTIADSLLSAIQSSTSINEREEYNHRKLKATILDLQRELQEKDVEMLRITEELASQIRDAETVARRSLTDLDSARTQVSLLEKKVSETENDKKLLESRISELKDSEASSQELQGKLKSLTDILAAKNQEIEGLKSGLMQALDEEESKTEALENRNMELEEIVQEKILALENVEASREKALTKLSTTVNKFDELHNLSENLLLEIESLESQLKERDAEISFLRQEVTRCTNNDLASQETNKKYQSQINDMLNKMEMMVSRFGESHIHANDENCSQIHVYTDILDKRIMSIMNELEDLRVTAQKKDVLLQMEKSRVEELLLKTGDLETVCNNEIQREPSQRQRDSVHSSSMNSPVHVETEQMVQRNKASSAPIVTHIRSGRKVNNDQIAIAIDSEKDDNLLDDEDDDKSHGFKSLTMSCLVPRATRPISDRVDGIWVSAERLLMRQPTLRLGVILYWILLHALLASII